MLFKKFSFLLFSNRSAYTEDDFTDYHESSYPWKKQDISNSVDRIDQVVHIELKEDRASFWNDTDRIHDQPQNNILPVDCVMKGSAIAAATVELEEFDQDDNTCTQSHCQNSGIVADSIAKERVDAGDTRQNNNDDEESYTKSQHTCCMEDTLNNDKELAPQESCHPLAVELSNKQQPDASDGDLQQQNLQTNQRITDIVDGLSGMVVQERAEDGCDLHTPHSSCLFSGKADEVEITNGITYELTTTDDRIFDNNFKTKQGNSDI